MLRNPALAPKTPGNGVLARAILLTVRLSKT